MATTISDNDAYTDVVELCALLQCVGFSVKSLDRDEGNLSQEGGARTVVINCPASGVHVVLESPSMSCSCPAVSPHNSGVWEVCGVAGGKQLDKEFGCGLLRSLPKQHRDRLTAHLWEMIRCIKLYNEGCETPIDKSASVTDLKTPEKLLQELGAGTPTRYRSLDTLTSKSAKESELPAPGTLQRSRLPSGCEDKGKNTKMCGREGTYTVSSTPGNSSGARRKNKTSSPIQFPCNNVLDTLSAALSANEEVHIKLRTAIQKLNDDLRDDSSMLSLALDVSKISVLKGECSKSQFASSPNLSVKQENLSKTTRQKCASSSNLDKKLEPKERKFSRLRRISPNIFKKETNNNIGTEKSSLDGKSRLRSLLKQRIATPVQHTSRSSITAGSPNQGRNKYSHIKSTIPRPTKKE